MQNLIELRSRYRILIQYLRYDVLRIRWKRILAIIRPLEFLRSNSEKRITLILLQFPRRVASKQMIQNNAECPLVNRIVVIAISNDHFGRLVLTRTTVGKTATKRIITLDAKAEVTDLDLHVFINQKVWKFHVTMYNEVFVEFKQHLEYLLSKVLHLQLCQCFSCVNHSL